ncbi:hypothetical protein FT663_02291 [Candidozyma haemuli var. vulneris]|nr:hypothetical protein FT663_02291 [[Candida] haemuloni var. vulneris]
MTIPLGDQFFVEKERNIRYEFLAMMVSFLLPMIHGILFSWIPYYLRTKRSEKSLNHHGYWTLMRHYANFTKIFKIVIFKHAFFVQPAMLVSIAIHLGLNAVLCVVGTKEIDYEPQYYVVSKRIGRIAVGNLPAILLFVAKNDFVSTVSGLDLDKSVFFHKWLGRFMFIAVTIHMALSLEYWLSLKFYIMIQIPPQIFGMISYACLGMLTFASFKFIRNFAFDFFLAQHRVFNFIMLLLAFFHNGGNKAAVLLAVHMLVLDRITSRVLGIVTKRRGPTKGKSEFEILDETTIRISIPVEIKDHDQDRWWWFLVPRYGGWRAGQHVYLNVTKVSLFQYHPFTIASLPDSGKQVIVLKVMKGFTKGLLKKLHKLNETEDPENSAEVDSVSSRASGISSPNSTTSLASEQKLMEAVENDDVLKPQVQELKNILDSFTAPRIFTMKAGVNGPYGAKYQPLTKFETVLFFSAGSGAVFTLPVALDLLKKLKQRDEAGDYMYRPEHTKVKIILCMKKKANLQWFDHLWEEFLPFFNEGRAHLALHVTSEQPEKVFEVKEKEKESKNETHEQTFIRQESRGSSSASLQDWSGYSVTHGRPQFDDIITDAATELRDPNYRRAMACVGCGPELFNGEITLSCQKNRKVKDAPDVYCYTESFG